MLSSLRSKLLPCSWMDSQNLTIEFIAAISLGVSTSGVDVPLEFVSKPGPEVVKGWLGGVGLGGRPLGNGEAKNPPLSHAECRAEVPLPLKRIFSTFYRIRKLDEKQECCAQIYRNPRGRDETAPPSRVRIYTYCVGVRLIKSAVKFEFGGSFDQAMADAVLGFFCALCDMNFKHLSKYERHLTSAIYPSSL